MLIAERHTAHAKYMITFTPAQEYNWFSTPLNVIIDEFDKRLEETGFVVILFKITV